MSIEAANAARSKPVANLVNLTDGQIALPPLPAFDKRVLILGAAVDRGVANEPQPEIPVTKAQLDALKSDKVFKALLAQRPRMVEFRALSLDISLE